MTKQPELEHVTPSIHAVPHLLVHPLQNTKHKLVQPLRHTSFPQLETQLPHGLKQTFKLYYEVYYDYFN